jgi:hypothetical protein
MTCKTIYGIQLIEILIIIMYLNVNRCLELDYENILKLYL